MLPKLIIFDLDGTLAESKQPLTDAMAALLAHLLERTRVSIASGGALEQFLKQVVARLPQGTHLENLYLLPTSGAALYAWSGGEWKKIYAETLSTTDAQKIEAAMRAAAAETGLIDFSQQAWGERIEYRGAQVSLSALGQQAPIEEKQQWDPDKAKRRTLAAALAARLPEFSVAMGGMTTIDVTKKDIDKAYGVRKLCERLGIAEKEALYVGDQLVAGGNDEAVFKTAVETRSVKDPADTAELIEWLLTV